jgi:beta-glucosidase
VGLASKTPINLQRETSSQLSVGFDYRVDQAPTSNVTLRMDCGPGCKGSVDLTETFVNTGRPGEWSHVKVPLACFANGAITRMDAITQPFELSTTGQLALSVANIRLESGTDALISCTP